uniref:FLYWCH-type domain-containing protein n=1 Tax=Meloidogyne incognita TaxID=6306 RepID=A0A914MLD8_MELIC
MANQPNVNETTPSTPPSSKIRPKLEQIQKQQPSTKRRRLAVKDEEINEESGEDFLVVDDVELDVTSSIKKDEQQNIGLEDDDDGEIVEFGRGYTNKGALCIWHNGYRYVRVRHDGPYWRCTESKCPAKASAVEHSDGRIVGKLRLEHSHLPQPERRLAEIKRHELKQRAREDPNLNRIRLIASIRAGVDDETFVAMGSDNALGIMAYREKAKLYGKGTSKISAIDVMSIRFPQPLIERGGQSILLYDSRSVRIHDNKPVFVFAHPY